MLKIAKTSLLALGIAVALPVIAVQASDGAEERQEVRGVTTTIGTPGTLFTSTRGGFVEPDSLR